MVLVLVLMTRTVLRSQGPKHCWWSIVVIGSVTIGTNGNCPLVSVLITVIMVLVVVVLGLGVWQTLLYRLVMRDDRHWQSSKIKLGQWLPVHCLTIKKINANNLSWEYIKQNTGFTKTITERLAIEENEKLAGRSSWELQGVSKRVKKIKFL